jgi:alkylation response protein AidB-like acyl-CoA dehydrogenase
MEFGPNDTQRLFGRFLRDYLTDRLPPDEVRRLARLGSGFDQAFWTGLVELGLAGVLVPEGHGGAGLGMYEAALAGEALGYFAAPAPFAGAAVMAPRALHQWGSAAQQAAWLPRIAAGTARFAVVFERGGGVAAGTIDRRHDRLSGRLTSGIDLGGATHVLAVLADGALAVLDADGPGVRVSTRPSLDGTRPVGEVELTDARAELLAAGDGLSTPALLDAGRVALAADTLGAAQRMLDRAVGYAREREQFGRPIGTFQAVKHMCAEMAAMLEPCRALVWYAAYAQDARLDDARLAACHAKAHLAEVGREVSRMATEVHGGMGFTDELGLHHWFKRISANRQLLGGPEHCRREAAALQGWGPPPGEAAPG